MKKFLFIILLFLSSCFSKIKQVVHKNSFVDHNNTVKDDYVHFSQDDSYTYVFIIIMSITLFFCFGLKYLPILYKKILSLTKKN